MQCSPCYSSAAADACLAYRRPASPTPAPGSAEVGVPPVLAPLQRQIDVVITRPVWQSHSTQQTGKGPWYEVMSGPPCNTEQKCAHPPTCAAPITLPASQPPLFQPSMHIPAPIT